MRKPLTDAELAELQDPDTWDWESAERHVPNPNAGAIVRVRLRGTEFDVIADAARACGSTLEAFMREAALAQASNGRVVPAERAAEAP
jgi:GTP cyclohydrolase II